MQAQPTSMNRAARRLIEKRKAKSKFSMAERNRLCEAIGLKASEIDYATLTDAELEKAQRILNSAEREAQIAYEAQQVANDLPFSNAVNFPRIAMVFEPVERVLNELETNGHIDSDMQGMPLLFSQNEGIWYPIVPALVSMCDTYTKLASTHGWSDETDGMRKFAKRLELSMPIFQQDVDRARGTIEWMKKQTLTITPNQFSVEVQEIRIRDEFRAVGVLAA